MTDTQESAAQSGLSLLHHMKLLKSCPQVIVIMQDCTSKLDL
jgi:hypothetical protein